MLKFMQLQQKNVFSLLMAILTASFMSCDSSSCGQELPFFSSTEPFWQFTDMTSKAPVCRLKEPRPARNISWEVVFGGVFWCCSTFLCCFYVFVAVLLLSPIGFSRVSIAAHSLSRKISCFSLRKLTRTAKKFTFVALTEEIFL